MPTTAEEKAKVLHKTFRGHPGRYAILSGNWKPRECMHNWKHILPHAEHGMPCGVYVMASNNGCYVSCADIDNHLVNGTPENKDWREDAEKLHEAVTDILPQAEPLVEVSQSGEGCHLWLRSREGLKAETVRRFWRKAADKAGMQLREVFPKQDSLKKTRGGVGSLVRYPLWGKSRFVDILDCWEELEPIEAMEGFPFIEEEDLLCLVGKVEATGGNSLNLGSGVDSLPPVVSLLINDPRTAAHKHWHRDTAGMADQTNSASRFGLIGGLHCRGIEFPEIVQAIRAWEDLHGLEPKSRATEYKLLEEYTKSVGNAGKGGYSHSQFAFRQQETLPTTNSMASVVAGAVQLDQVEERESTWVWEQRIPEGETTIVYGQSGSYKTWFGLEVIRHVTTGFPWPDGTKGPEGDAVLISSEDTVQTIKKRARIIGLNTARLTFIDSTEHPVTFEDIPELVRELRRAGKDVRLIVVDPCDGHLGPGKDTNSAIDVRNALEAVRLSLTGYSDTDDSIQSPVSLIGIHHINKKSDQSKLQAAAGSRAWVNVPRTCIYMQSNGSTIKPRITLEWAKANVSEGLPPTVEAFFGNGFEYITFNKEQASD